MQSCAVMAIIILFCFYTQARDTAASNQARGVTAGHEFSCHGPWRKKGCRHTKCAGPTRNHGAQQGTTLPDSATRQPRPTSAAGPGHASMTEDFSSCPPGRHLGPGLVTLQRGPIPSTLRRPARYAGWLSQQGEFLVKASRASSKRECIRCGRPRFKMGGARMARRVTAGSLEAFHERRKCSPADSPDSTAWPSAGSCSSGSCAMTGPDTTTDSARGRAIANSHGVAWTAVRQSPFIETPSSSPTWWSPETG